MRWYMKICACVKCSLDKIQIPSWILQNLNGSNSNLVQCVEKTVKVEPIFNLDAANVDYAKMQIKDFLKTAFFGLEFNNKVKQRQKLITDTYDAIKWFYDCVDDLHLGDLYTTTVSSEKDWAMELSVWFVEE